MSTRKALRLNVFKNKLYDGCANGGITERYDTLLLLCENGYIDVDMDNPPENLVVLERKMVCGNTCYCIKPYAPVSTGCVGWMSGGAYAGCSDSRFSEMLNGFYGAVSVHDRQETQEQCDWLSR